MERLKTCFAYRCLLAESLQSVTLELSDGCRKNKVAHYAYFGNIFICPNRERSWCTLWNWFTRYTLTHFPKLYNTYTHCIHTHSLTHTNPEHLMSCGLEEGSKNSVHLLWQEVNRSHIQACWRQSEPQEHLPTAHTLTHNTHTASTHSHYSQWCIRDTVTVIRIIHLTNPQLQNRRFRIPSNLNPALHTC